jgi:hypothetical protein
MLKETVRISINEILLFELSEIQKKVILNDILEEDFEEDIKRRLKHALLHKYEQCYLRIKTEWDKKLQNRVGSVPTDQSEYAQLVFSQPDYKSRSERETK